jgi:hypothetical protein
MSREGERKGEKWKHTSMEGACGKETWHKLPESRFELQDLFVRHGNDRRKLRETNIRWIGWIEFTTTWNRWGIPISNCRWVDPAWEESLESNFIHDIVASVGDVGVGLPCDVWPNGGQTRSSGRPSVVSREGIKAVAGSGECCFIPSFSE